MKKRLCGFIVIIFLLVIIAIISNSYLQGRKETSTNVQTVTVTRRDIGSTVLATGIIKPMVGAEVKVGSRISGVVKELRANIGDFVEAGQIIAQLDDAELKTKINQVTAAQTSAKANLEYAKINQERQRNLFDRNIASQQELDLAENAYKVAEAQLEQSKANVEFVKVQLSYTKISAPISGVIGSISTQEGETVSASLAAPTFVTIIDLRRLEVQAYVDETDIGKIKDSQEASFTVDTYSDIDFKGKVTAIYPRAVIKDNVVNYIVTIKIINFQGKILRPEMTTFVKIFLEKRKNVLVVLSSAIRREKGEKFVSVWEDTKIIPRKIETGWQDDGYTEIIEGLKEGEKVVITEIIKEHR